MAHPRQCTCRMTSPLYCPCCAALALRAGVVVPMAGITAPAALAADAAEADFQARLSDCCHALGYLYYHTYSSKRSSPGWPDTAIINPNAPETLYLWELKAGTRQSSPAQRRWLDALAQVERVQAGVYYPRDWPALYQRLTHAQG